MDKPDINDVFCVVVELLQSSRPLRAVRFQSCHSVVDLDILSRGRGSLGGSGRHRFVCWEGLGLTPRHTATLRLAGGRRSTLHGRKAQRPGGVAKAVLKLGGLAWPRQFSSSPGALLLGRVPQRTRTHHAPTSARERTTSERRDDAAKTPRQHHKTTSAGEGSNMRGLGDLRHGRAGRAGNRAACGWGALAGWGE